MLDNDKSSWDYNELVELFNKNQFEEVIEKINTFENLSENNISFEQKGDSTVIPGLSKLDALEIMTNIEENNVAIESFTFSVDDSSSIILSINFDG